MKTEKQIENSILESDHDLENYGDLAWEFCELSETTEIYENNWFGGFDLVAKMPGRAENDEAVIEYLRD